MPASEALHVHGLRELERAFIRAGVDTKKEIRVELKQVGEPVRAAAERKAATEITRIGPRWSQMRVGVTQKLVYVAPKQRGRFSRANPRLRRPNLAGLLMDRAMAPALAEKAPEVEEAFGRMLDRISSDWER